MPVLTHKLGVTGIHLLEAWLIKTTKRLTFQINYQAPEITNTDITAIKQFTATNGYDVISEHRMDIQSRRIWLLGAESDQPAIRSGTMATPVQSLCDEGFTGTIEALHQWATHNNGYVTLHTVDAYATINQLPAGVEQENKSELWDYYQELIKDHGFNGITDLLTEHSRLLSVVKNSIEAPDAIKLLQRVATSSTDSIPAPKPQNCCSCWRNDAIENAAIIADKYEQNYCAQDIRNMKRPIPAQQAIAKH